MNTENGRWGVIDSSRAGSFKAHKRWDMIRRYMESRGVQYDFVQSEGFGSVERLTKMLCSNGYHTIVLVGGDGTLNDALNGILQFDKLPDDFAFGQSLCCGFGESATLLRSCGGDRGSGSCFAA